MKEERAEIKIVVRSGRETREISAPQGANLLEILRGRGFFLDAPCGGRGRCGKCGVRLISGEVEGAVPDGQGRFLSCLARVSGPLEIEVFERQGGGLLDAAPGIAETDGETGYGVALDLGTTTLAFYLIELSTGRELDRFACLNPQAVFGGDVVSRISACAEGHLSDLFALVRDRTSEVLKTFADKHGIPEISRLTVCGNTTMLHLFKDTDASPLGVAPFTPAFSGTQKFSGETLGLPAREVVLLPNIGAYVGADISAGLLAVKLGAGGAELFADIGTNGEMAVRANGKFLCTSTAAGPAFEGANISCGMGGVPGAIDRVWTESGEVRFRTLGGISPAGLCGCGLVDAIRVMLELGVIDETGAFLEGESFRIAENVAVTQKDVREFQLAKSAVCAGLKVLMRRAGVEPSDVVRLCVAGGLGFWLDPVSAEKTGLIPSGLADRIEVVGNSAGAGAKLCLLSADNLRECERIAETCEVVDLSEDPDFMDEYIGNMTFGEPL